MLGILNKTVTKCCHARWKRYRPVEPLEHNCVFSAEVIRWERVGLPAKSFISIGQVLSSGNICTELEEEKNGVNGSYSGGDGKHNVWLHVDLLHLPKNIQLVM